MSILRAKSSQNLLGFSISLLLFMNIVILSSFTYSVKSVVMPPRLQSPYPDPPVITKTAASLELDDPDDEVPYLLSINEGLSIDIKIGSKSAITVNLNRAVPEDLKVVVSVQSRPELIIFDGEIQNNTKSNNTVEIIYLKNTFGDRIVSFHTNNAAGHAEIVCKAKQLPSSNITIDDTTSFISVNVGKSDSIEVIITLVGWIYFFAWSLSFYFQVILNYQRKSVVGLNFDFLALNLMGFTCYTIFNYSLMFSREAQKDYYDRHEFSRIPVEYNDLFFAAHAVILTLITVIQCFIYERGQQNVSLPAISFIILSIIGGIVCVIIYLVNTNTFLLLDVLLYFSYVKLIITLIKYTPQAYMNYKRKATTGWSIHNIILDFTGGSFSIGQMFLIAYNYDDWISIFGNFTKFGLGAISITFDVLFLVQHYVLYKQIGELEVSTESIPSPVINQSVIIASFRQPSEDEENTQDNGSFTNPQSQQQDNQAQ